MSLALWIILTALTATVVFAAGFMTGVRQATRNWLGLRVEAWWRGAVVIGALIVAVLLPLTTAVVNWAVARWRRHWVPSCAVRYGVLLGALDATCNAVIFTATGVWPVTLISVTLAAAGWWLWWWLGRRRDRAPRQFGAKSRLLLEALVERMRESARPRLVLSPIPGGAA